MKFMILPLLLFSVLSQAGVSLKNGNYFNGYQDVIFPGGFEPKVLRVFNSKSEYFGYFGYGWSSEYETNVREMADGSVVVFENGGGEQTHFSGAGYDKNSVAKGAEAIVKAMRAKTPMGNEQAENLKKTLIEDPVQRQRYASAYNVKSQVAVNTVLTSKERGLQSLKKVQNGWIRTSADGMEEHFSDTGKLIKIVDRNKNWLILNYDKNNVLQFVKDNFNRQIDFKFNNFGRIIEVSAPQKKATYKYDGIDLIESKDVDGNIYKYTYTKDGRHNLVKITYGDNTTQSISYYPIERYELTKKIVDRDGTTIDYNYGENPQSPKDNYWTEVLTKTKDGTLISKAKHEYWIKKKIDGSEFTKKLKSDVDGDLTVTEYNENNLPEKIEKNGRITSFKYSTDGLLTEKDTPFEKVKLNYDSKWNKVSKVEKLNKGSKTAKAEVSEYTYDDKGNLKSASAPGNKKVSLIYDETGRIHTMVDQEQRKIQFKYNEFGKPVEIIDTKLGKITVEYTNTGDIKNVHSEAGRKVAMQVTQAFQNLLEIIKPAGVTLTAN